MLKYDFSKIYELSLKGIISLKAFPFDHNFFVKKFYL